MIQMRLHLQKTLLLSGASLLLLGLQSFTLPILLFLLNLGYVMGGVGRRRGRGHGNAHTHGGTYVWVSCNCLPAGGARFLWRCHGWSSKELFENEHGVKGVFGFLKTVVGWGGGGCSSVAESLLCLLTVPDSFPTSNSRKRPRPRISEYKDPCCRDWIRASLASPSFVSLCFSFKGVMTSAVIPLAGNLTVLLRLPGALPKSSWPQGLNVAGCK